MHGSYHKKGKASLVYLFFLIYFLARCIAVVSIVSICLVCDFSIVATCHSIPAARFAFCLCFIRILCCSKLFCLVNKIRTKGESWSIVN